MTHDHKVAGSSPASATHLVGYSVIGRVVWLPLARFKIPVMNQYDFLPIPPEDRAKVRHYIIACVFAVIVIIFAVCMLGCNKEREAPKLTGAWNSVTYPANYYIFHDDGTMELHTLAAGQIVWQKWYIYKQDRITDALEITDRNGLCFQGIVHFNGTADTAVLIPDGGLKIIIAKW